MKDCALSRVSIEWRERRGEEYCSSQERARVTSAVFEKLIGPPSCLSLLPIIRSLEIILDNTFVRARPHSSDQPSRPRLT